MAGGWRSRTPWGPQDIASESRRDRHHDKQLHDYFENVVARVGRASSVFVLGPGEAKQELIAAFARSPRHRDTSTERETADKLTERQIVARVKAHFGP